MDKSKLRPCPFCGADPTALQVEILSCGRPVHFQGNYAKLTCLTCGVTMEAESQPERFDRVEGDLYRLIPHKYAEEVLTKKWNGRTDEMGGDGDG